MALSSDQLYSALGYFAIPFLEVLKLFKSSGSKPLELYIEPSTSDTPITFPPFSVINLEAQNPTLPYPYTINVLPAMPIGTLYIFINSSSFNKSLTA